tara:strand:+ start:735 stop:1076 length:342 start_codon:yes stop_codon:yes gene_type:complete
MILEYTIETSILEKDAYHDEINGQRFTKDLMITYYTPTNFKGTIKNYTLGQGHPYWDRMHQEALEKFHKEWLVELNYDPEKYFVANDTLAIVRHQTVGTLTTFELPVTKSEEI